MEWTAEIDTERGLEEISISTECYGGKRLVDEPRRALGEAIENWLRFDLVQSWAESVSRDRQSRQGR